METKPTTFFPRLCARLLLAGMSVAVLAAPARAVIVSAEDVMQLQKTYAEFRDTSSRTANALKRIWEEYLVFKKQYGADPRFKGIFERLNSADVSTKLRVSYQALEMFYGAADKIDRPAEFFNRYRPDQNDPVRPLLKISDAIDDFQRSLPVSEEVKKPASGVIDTYIGAASAYAEGLLLLDKKKEEYRKETIGVSGKTDIVNADQVKQYARQGFSDPIQRSADLLLFSPAEIWVSLGEEGNAYVWDGVEWHRSGAGIGFLKDLADAYLSSTGQLIPTEQLITQVKDERQAVQRIVEAKWLYDVLISMYDKGDNECYRCMLQSAGKPDEAIKVLSGCRNREDFIGRYLFFPEKHEDMRELKNYLDTHVGIAGTVMYDDEGELLNLPGAVVVSRGASVTTNASGAYSLVLAQKKGSVAIVSAEHPKYPSVQQEVRLDGVFLQGINFVLNRTTEPVQDADAAVVNAQNSLARISELYTAFSRYYGYFTRMTLHGSAITSPAGGAAASPVVFGGQMARVLAYPFVQAQKKSASLLAMQNEFTVVEDNLRSFPFDGSPQLQRLRGRVAELKESIYGSEGVASRFADMQQSLWEYGCTEEQLHASADGMPDDLDPSFATNILGTDGMTPATR